MIHRLLALATVLSLGACDSLAPPEPTNPYDAAFEGRRITSPPSDVRVTETSSTSVTLEWTRESSFGAGYRVEVSPTTTALGSQPYDYIVPPEATRLVIEFPDTTPRRIRIVGLGSAAEAGRPGGVSSAPSAPITVRFRGSGGIASLVQTPTNPRYPSNTQFGQGGTRFYTGFLQYFSGRPQQEIKAIDPMTGTPVWIYSGAQIVMGVTDDGGAVGIEEEDRTSVHVISPTGNLVRTVRIEGLDACPFRTLAVSGDGTRAVGRCGTDQSTRIWDLTTGAPLASLSRTYEDIYGFGASPDILFVRQASRLRAVAWATEAVQWSRPSSSGARPVAVSADRRTIATVEAAGGSTSLRLLDAATGGSRRSKDIPEAYGRRVFLGGLDAQTVVYGDIVPSRYARFIVADAASLEPIQSFETEQPELQIDDGLLLFAATPEGAVGFRQAPPNALHRFLEWDVNGQWEVAPPEAESGS